MDNKLTKKRLHDMLSYEWIFMIVMCVISIIIWEIMYSVGSVKLTAGQRFRYYYDYTIFPAGNTEFRRELVGRDTFSYDVLKLGTESISKDHNVLTNRLAIQEGDVIFTDLFGIEEYKDSLAKDEIPTEGVRAFSIIDTVDYKIGAIEVMFENAKKYLKDNFFVDTYNEGTDGYGAENIDQAKVKKVFLSRNGKDNRFRKTSAINKGIEQEKQRIVKLCENVVFMQEFFNKPKYSDALVRYTRFSQSYELTKDVLPNNYEKWLNNEKTQGREDLIYGINLGKLSGGRNITDFMQYKEDEKFTDIVVLAFDFSSHQPHLQYESLSFICSTIRICIGE